jgi:hypothetical protein
MFFELNTKNTMTIIMIGLIVGAHVLDKYSFLDEPYFEVLASCENVVILLL